MARLMSMPTSRSPTAVAAGSTRLTAPPIAQPLICPNGDVIAPTRSTNTHEDEPDDRLAEPLRRQERHGRGRHHGDADPELVRGIGEDLGYPAEHLVGLLDGPEHRAAEHHRADRVQPVVEGGHDAEVAAAAP